MLTLVKAQVWKYKSIEDSTPVELSPQVTVLVGKNESGKTAFLEALHKAMPLGAARYDYILDYPRRDYRRYHQQHLAGNYQRVVELTFRIEKPLADRINKEVFGGAEVVAPGGTFTRNTSIANTHTTSFYINEKVALVALQRALADQAHMEDAFSDATSLADVLIRIDSLKLPADNRLAAFAAQWRGCANAEGWKLVNGYIWDAYLSPALPKFLYFDDYKLLEGKVNLPTLERREKEGKLTDADETVLGLLQLAGTSLDELMNAKGYESVKAELEAIGLDITEKIFRFWKQNRELDVEFDLRPDETDAPPFNQGTNLYIRVRNRRHGVSVPFDQRSKGFIWFFSFLVWFDAVQSRSNTRDTLILLLDEPGLNLHALAQADFLSYIHELAQEHQIIYTTHSPFMVQSSRLEDVRVVEDRPADGTRVTADLAGSSDESVYPLQAALGYSIVQNLFVSKKNILVEGPADLLVLQHMSSLLEAKGKVGLGDAVLTPAGGLEKLATFVALLGAKGLKLAVLHDKDGSARQNPESLIQQKLVERKRVFDYSLFIEPQPEEADLEDLLPPNLYVIAFNTAYAKALAGITLTLDDLGSHPRLVERINQWLKSCSITLARDGGFNRYRVIQAVLPLLSEAVLSDADLARFERLFTRIGEAL